MQKSNRRKRVRETDNVWTALREAQRECGCNTKTLETVLKTVTPFLKADVTKTGQADGELKKATDAVVLQLHGCVGCNDFVFEVTSARIRCPKCRHPRFKRNRKPNEVFFYFPLKHQLENLLQCEAYRELLMWETRRDSNARYMSDVYDTPRWRQVAGEPTDHLSRIVFQLCVDSFPWQSRKHGGSVKPWQISLLSLPPWVRYRPKFMLCFAVIPNGLKLQEAKKYYDWAAKYEMNSLHTRGVYGVRVIMYGTSLDSPGRRELLAMQSVQSYYPCPMCMHTWQPGPRKITHGGYRRFLDPGHPWRAKTFREGDHQYEFRDVERRPPPVKRTDVLVSLAILRAKPNRPFLGHKWMPLLSCWLGADWGRSMPDKMHDMKCFAEMILRGFVGKAASGFYAGWGRKDEQHRDECRVFGIFADFVAGAVPPWRLTDIQRKFMDQRVKSIWWTHYCDKLAWKGHSFWNKTDRLWKAKHKILCLFTILPTCLRGFVAAAHLAIIFIVDAIRQLDGQCIAIHEAEILGVSPRDSQVVDKSKINALGTQLLEGLVMLEGSFPVSHLNPALHHLVHYAAETARVGSLGWISMNAFERNNKRMKGLVRGNRNPEASLANDTQVDIAARASSLVDTLVDTQPPPLISFRTRISGGLYVPTRRQRYCMSLIGVKNFVGIQGFNVAWIQGVHFACGEWGLRTCGSVFTTVYCGRSVYGILDRFMLVGGVEYAAVTWLSQPFYPYAPITLVVRVRMLPKADQPLNRCVIRCDRIEPCGVNVMPDEDGVHYYMMRTRGIDRRPPE